MRGADEAMGNLLKVGGQKPHPAPQLTRVFPRHVAENTAERADAVPAGLQRDLDDWKIRVTQQRHGPLHPAGQQIAVRGYAKSIAKRSREVRL